MTDYCTITELKARTGTTLAGSDTVLTALVTAASRALDALCNRPDGFVAVSTAVARLYSGSGQGWQAIDECAAITKVEVKDSPTDSSYTEWAATEYLPFSGDARFPDFNRTPYTGLLVVAGGSYSIFTSGRFVTRGGFRPDPGAESARGVPTVRVTAKWGYATDVPAAIKEAAVAQASRWWKRGQSAWADTLASPELGVLLYRKEIDPDIAMIVVQGRYVRPVL